MKYLYRYESGYPDEWSAASIHLLKLTVVRESEKTYWVRLDDWGTTKQARKGARNTYAYPTKDQAFENYKRRTEKYLAILKNNARNVEKCFELVPQVDIENDHCVVASGDAEHTVGYNM